MPGLPEYEIIRDGWLKVPTPAGYLKRSPRFPDRWLLGVNLVLVRAAGRTILIDTGLGDKPWRRRVGEVEFEQPRRLMEGLRGVGVGADDIDSVVLSHLHYDHCGGAVQVRGETLAPTFTNALYFVQRAEWEYALRQVSNEASSYLADNFIPLKDFGVLRLVDGEHRLAPGVELMPAPGHTPGLQVVLVSLGDEVLFYPGDLVATPSHLGVKLSPSHNWNVVRADQERRRWGEQAYRLGWRCVFCHAPRTPLGRMPSPASGLRTEGSAGEPGD